MLSLSRVRFLCVSKQLGTDVVEKPHKRGSNMFSSCARCKHRYRFAFVDSVYPMLTHLLRLLLFVRMADDETSKYIAVFDLETQDAISNARGHGRDEKIASLEVSCASVLSVPSHLAMIPHTSEHAIEMSNMRTFWRDGESRDGMGALLKVLDGAELIVGFNLVGFDWIVMKKYYRNESQYHRHRSKTHDIFSRVRDATGLWFKLDRLLQLNGLEKKTADGLAAIRMWAEGNRYDLRHYCETDVRQCARLSLLSTMNVGLSDQLENQCGGVASALAAKRFASKLTMESTHV